MPYLLLRLQAFINIKIKYNVSNFAFNESIVSAFGPC